MTLRSKGTSKRLAAAAVLAVCCVLSVDQSAAQETAVSANGGTPPGRTKAPEKLPQSTKDLKGSVVVAIDPVTGDITPYLEKNPTRITIPDGVDIKSIVSLPGSDYVILTYEASPAKTVLCRWVGSTYTCYEA